ncbi:MAG: sigma-70 family RNA polymerase sigma factor, partial [Chthoniobacteraceae bacterium]
MSSASPSEPPGDFATTRWSVVLTAAGGGAGSGAHAALTHLCSAYWFPLYAFIRRQGHGPHDAQELTQEFFARLLAKSWLGGVDRERGKFRSWLLASVKHFLANEWDRAHAVKRGGRVALVSFDDAEQRYLAERADADDPARLFDRRWALTLLDRVLLRLRDEMVEAGKLAQFDALKGVLSGEKARYAEIAGTLQMS